MERQQALYDELEDWQRELVQEYGMNTTYEVLRMGRGMKHAIATLQTKYKPLRRR